MSLIARLTLLIQTIKASFTTVEERVTVLERKITISDTAPSNPEINDVWIHKP